MIDREKKLYLVILYFIIKIVYHKLKGNNHKKLTLTLNNFEVRR